MRDRDVRRQVLQMLDNAHAGDHDTLILQEMGVWSGSVRIDVAVVNGALSGFELKSDRDTLQRLPVQSSLYSRVFDEMTLVVGSKHAAKAEAYIPDWWGIIEAHDIEGEVELRVGRETQSNPTLDPYLVAQLLWRDEAVQALEIFGIAAGWRSKRVKAIHERLAADVPLSLLRQHVRGALKRRVGWLRQN